MQAPATTDATTQVHLLSHNHWDREWIFTAKYANRWLPTFFDNLLRRLAEQPDYRFVLDGQTLIIEDYLRQLPPDEAAARERDIRRYVHRGQLQVGPAYLQPDWSLVSGEALVRNLLIGGQMAARYGRVMKVGWLLDNFGQIAQAPQIFKGFGIEGAFVWRGVEMPPEKLSTEFWWTAPDGSRILGVYLLDSYRNAMVLGMTREIAQQRIASHAQTLRRFASTPNVLLMNGYEQVPEPDNVLPIIAEVNQTLGPALHCRQSTPPEYLQAILRHDPDLPELGGYLYSGRYAPILKGVYSSRSYLNQQNNDCQRELERWAEKFNAFAWAFGFDYPEARFRQTWKTLLLNHTHDDMCGCCIDPIARDMEDRFAEVARMAHTLSSESMRALAQAVDTSRGGGETAVIIYNPSSRGRRQAVPVSLEIPEELADFHIRDGRGQCVPHQTISRIGSKTDLTIWADVPALGYKTYFIHDGAQTPEPHPTVCASAADHILENEYLRVKINNDGSLTIHEKIHDDVYHNVAYFEDGGDCGDTYDYSHPAQDTLITSLGQKAKISLVTEGELVACFRVELQLHLPESLTPDRQARSEARRALPIVSFIELSANAGHVEITTEIHNTVKDHRLRVLFPSGIAADVSHAGAPFDVAKFPIEEEPVSAEIPEQLAGLMLAGRYTAPVNTRPFQNFVSLANEAQDQSFSIFSRGLSEYEVLPQDNTIALTLLRGVGWLARADLLTRTGDVGPHIFTPEAQGLGVQTFDYAIYPHGGDLRLANPQSESDRTTLKFRAIQTNAHDGRLPDQFSFLSWVAEKPKGAFKLTALKKSEEGDAIIVRFYNALERKARGHIKIGGQVVQAWRTNLNEENETELKVEDGTVQFKARPKEIVTIKVKLRPWKLIEDFQTHPARVLLPVGPANGLPPAEALPLLTAAEVQREQQRADDLARKLRTLRSEAYELNEAIARQNNPPVEQLAALQKLKGDEATLARQHYEARISALLNQQLLVTSQMEAELDEIGESLNWARVRKRVGEFLTHYYEGVLGENGR